MRFDILDNFIVIFAILTPILIFGVILLGNGTITIQKDYYDEYKECQQAKAPQCAPCVCQKGFFEIFFNFLIMMVGIVVGSLLSDAFWKNKVEKYYKLKRRLEDGI